MTTKKHAQGKLVRNLSTPEMRRWWAAVERAARCAPGVTAGKGAKGATMTTTKRTKNAKATAAEREACARIADAFRLGREAVAADAKRDHQHDRWRQYSGEAQTAGDIAAAIRARGRKE